MIRREITGPQAKYERTGAQGFRDVRPTTARLSEVLRGSASAFVLTGLGGATWFYPALLNVTVPGSVLYATWVLTQRVVLPLRLPRAARRKDWGNPDPANRKPRQASGTHYVGRDALTGQELWLTNEDARQHASIPGTTGAGKTTAILGQLANSLAMGSGFVLVDGKADNKLFGEVMALARRFGREDDVLALNFLVASGVKESNTFNPFAAGNADAIRELLVSQLGEQQSNDQNGVFRGRAVALIGTIAPVLAWMRDTYGISINIEAIRFSMELRWIGILAVHKVFLVRNRAGGNPDEIPVPDIPDEILYPLQAYLGEIPGYDTSVAWNQQKDSKPSEQHGFALMYFTNTFTQLSVSLGHIFKVQAGDIDMRDVVLNRRILVVNLPALENSDDTLAALGKIVVASLRGMMAQMLGARLEGKPDEIFSLKPGTGDGPFYIVFDELAYYASSGMDRMLAMGRGLNMTFWLAFQEVSGIWARLGEKTASLLGNANLTLAMRQQDANRTREWLEKTAGQTFVTQATTYQGGSIGQYREAQHAEVKQVSRVDWGDLQRLIEGEAIVLFAGRRVYAKLFHAQVDTKGPVRLNRPVMLAPPSSQQLRADLDETADLVRTLVSGEARFGVEPEGSVLAALLGAFASSLKAGSGARVAAQAACEAAGQAHREGTEAGQIKRPGGAGAEPPVTDLLPMLEMIAAKVADQDTTAAGLPANPVSADLMRALVAIETASGCSPQLARRRSLTVLAERDRALQAKPVAKPPQALAPTDLAKLINRFTDRLAA